MDLKELNEKWSDLITQNDKIQYEISTLLRRKGELYQEILDLKIAAWKEGYNRDQEFDKWVILKK